MRLTISEYDMMASSPFHKKTQHTTHDMVLMMRGDTFRCAICGNLLSLPTIFTYCPLWNHNDDKVLYDYRSIEEHYGPLNDAVRDYYKNNIEVSLLSTNDGIDASIVDIIYSYC